MSLPACCWSFHVHALAPMVPCARGPPHLCSPFAKHHRHSLSGQSCFTLYLVLQLAFAGHWYRCIVLTCLQVVQGTLTAAEILPLS